MEVPAKFRLPLVNFRKWLYAFLLIAAATVLVSCGGGGGGGSSTKIVLLPATLTLEGDPLSINTDGSTTLKATVRDENGDEMAGVIVEFEVTNNQSNGDFDGNDSVQVETNNLGQATVEYFAGANGGVNDTITATALANPIANTTKQVVITINYVPGAAPDSIALDTPADSIPADGETATFLRATVLREDLSPGDNIEVDFKIISGIGTLSSDSGTTGTDGTVTISLTSVVGSSGATVRASVHSNPLIYADIAIQFTLGTIEVLTPKDSLLGTGTETTTITASIFDVDGAPMGAGETINFTLSDNSLGSLDSSSTTTDASGQVTVELTGSANAGTVTVTATWVSDSGNISGSVDITIYPSPAYIEIAPGTPDPTSLAVKGTGGQTASLVSFIVKDENGDPVASGYRVMFKVEAGPGGGEKVIPAFDATDEDGVVTTILHSGSKSGSATVKASYYSVADATTIYTVTSPVAINSGLPVGQEFGISAEYFNISGLNISGLEDTITVSAGDIYGNPVPNTNLFSFKTYNMGGLILTKDVFPLNGFASTTLTSTSDPQPVQGFTFVTAETIGGISTHITSLAVTAGLNGESILYAGTDGGGIYKSNDSGGTWLNISRSTESEKHGQNIIDPYVKGNSAISIDPDNPNTVYAGTGYKGSGQIFRSLDGGANWNSNNPEEVFGLFQSPYAAVLTVLVDGDGDDIGDEYVWAGTEGDGVWLADDGATFVKATSGLSGNQTVRDIVKSPNSPGDGATALLYAATLSGVYCSSNGGDDWTEATNFTGDNINSIAVYDHLGTDILYVGTEEYGVWTGISAGGCAFTWASAPATGLGSGVSATIPTPAIENTGTGTMSPVDVGVNAKSETWTLTASISATTPAADTDNVGNGTMSAVTVDANAQPESWTLTATDSATFSVVGSESGTLDDTTVGVLYTDADAGISFTINAGGTAYAAGDIFTFATFAEFEVTGTISNTLGATATVGTSYEDATAGIGFTVFEGAVSFRDGDIFTFDTSRDPGLSVKDVLVDPSNLQVYALTYFTGDQVEYSAGNVYSHAIDVNTGLFDGNGWSFANQNLPQYADVSYRYPQYAIAANDPANPTKLFIGGAGINFYKASSGLATGTPSWRTSKSGLNNTIMARIPVVFTDDQVLDITYYGSGSYPSSYNSVIDDIAQVTLPAPGPNVGNGTMGFPGVYEDATPQTWTLTALDDTTFAVVGSVSGIRPPATVDETYIDYYTGIIFYISKGSVDFAAGDTFTFQVIAAKPDYLFEIYIEDYQGNPPIEGSTFTAVHTWEARDDNNNCTTYSFTYYDIDYSDVYTYLGTWRDPYDGGVPANENDIDTNNPYYFATNLHADPTCDQDDTFTITFTPACSESSPGCSGDSQEYVYTFSRL